VARILSVVFLGGEVDEIRFLSLTTIELIFDEQAKDVALGSRAAAATRTSLLGPGRI
jgi:hypothetical protein